MNTQQSTFFHLQKSDFLQDFNSSFTNIYQRKNCRSLIKQVELLTLSFGTGSLNIQILHSVYIYNSQKEKELIASAAVRMDIMRIGNRKAINRFMKHQVMRLIFSKQMSCTRNSLYTK